MSKNKKIPEFKSYEEMTTFWETHSLADYWEQTEPADFQMAKDAGHRYPVSVDRDLLNRIQKLAHLRGISTESLVNLLLEQRLKEIEPSSAQKV